MALFVDAITAPNLIKVVTDNIDKAFDATNKGIKEFVDLVISKLPKDEKMTALRIWGHGFIDRPDGNAIFGRDNLSLESIGSFEPYLERLTPYFEKPARAELRGCQPAKGKGKAMMEKLADIWKVDVYGAEKSQFLIAWNPPVWVAPPQGPCKPAQGIEVFEKR